MTRKYLLMTYLTLTGLKLTGFVFLICIINVQQQKSVLCIFKTENLRLLVWNKVRFFSILLKFFSLIIKFKISF